MKEELITFETAKLAKEKGFDIFTGIAYIQKVNQEIFFTPAYTGITNGIDYHVPSQSQLQKWLREVHNIKVLVTTHNEVNAKYSSIVLYPPTKGWSLSRDKFLRWTNLKGSLADESYEKVLESGLQEALKLIEISQKQ
jgi:hypothetical protein